MADLVRTDSRTVNAAIDDYHEAALALALLALNGTITEREYMRRHTALTENVIRAVFLLSGGNEADNRAAAWLGEQIAISNTSARKLAKDLYDGRYSQTTIDGEIQQTSDEGIGKLIGRLAIWTAVLGRAYHRGHLYPVIPPDVRIETVVGTWHVGPTDHCPTCLELDGQTKTADAWAQLAAIGVEPQGTGLDCGGYRCQCGITWTTEIKTAV